MSQELQRISFRELKGRIRRAAENAENAPMSSMVELRQVFERLVLELYRGAKPDLPDAGKEDPNIEKKASAMTAVLKEGGVLHKTLAGPVFDSLKRLAEVIHYEPGTQADVIRPLNNLLTVLRRLETEEGKILKGLSPADLPRADPNGPLFEKGVTVVLACISPESEVSDQWDQLCFSLSNWGVTLVPGRLSALNDEFRQAARKAEFFIQVFSALDALDPARSQKKAFLDACGLEEGSKRVLQWRRKLEKSSEKTDVNVDSLVLRPLTNEDVSFCEDAEDGIFAEFTADVRERLNRLIIGEKLYLYFVADRSNRRDELYARELQKIAHERVQATAIALPTGANPKSFSKWIKSSYGFVFLYGDTEVGFIEEHGNRYIDNIKKLEKAKLHAIPCALFQAPPGPEREAMRQVEPFVALDWRKYGSRHEFRPQDIVNYCMHLRRNAERHD
jgi:hypothetical protein